jgi:hypothetical protein
MIRPSIPSIHATRRGPPPTTPATPARDADRARAMRDNYLHSILHRSPAVASSRRRRRARKGVKGGGRHPSALTWFFWGLFNVEVVFSGTRCGLFATREDDDDDDGRG